MLSAELEVDSEGFIKLVQAGEIAPGEMVQVTFDWQGENREVALANTEGEIYAFRDVCPHAYFPLSIGHLKGTKLECRGHNWQFDLKSGKTLYPPIRKTLEKYEVKIINGTIWIKL